MGYLSTHGLAPALFDMRQLQLLQRWDFLSIPNTANINPENKLKNPQKARG